MDEFKDRHRGRGYFGGERRTSKQSERIVFPKVHNEKERGREQEGRGNAQKGQRGGRSREEDSGCSSKRVSPSLDNTLTV